MPNHLLTIGTLALTLLLAGCESELQTEQVRANRVLRIQAWESCIASGGAPIEAWIGAPSMQRCDYKEIEHE